MIQVNLLPDSKQKGIKQQRTKQAALSVSILIMLISIGLPVALFVTDFLLEKTISSRQGKIDKLVSDYESKKNIQRILTVQSQLKSLPDVEDNSYYTSNLLAMIEFATPNNVGFISLTALSEEGTFELQASSESIAAANKFIDTLESIQLKQGSEGGSEDSSSSVGAFTAPLVRSFSQDSRGVITFNVEGQLNSEFGNVKNVDGFILKPYKLELDKDRNKELKIEEN